MSPSSSFVSPVTFNDDILRTPRSLNKFLMGMSRSEKMRRKRLAMLKSCPNVPCVTFMQISHISYLLIGTTVLITILM